MIAWRKQTRLYINRIVIVLAVLPLHLLAVQLAKVVRGYKRDRGDLRKVRPREIHHLAILVEVSVLDADVQLAGKWENTGETKTICWAVSRETTAYIDL